MTLEASRSAQLAKISALESHQREVLDKNRCLHHRLVVVTVEKEQHGPQDAESKKPVTDAKVELENVE